ncbi:hypothetical protein JT359_06845 [Candidatus Poribacteria bacterium]|nr:hypothetical protein [Candidatus Poribacteria bacterium]
MVLNHQKKRTEKVYRSIVEVKKHFFPNSYKKELEYKKGQDPNSFGTALVEGFFEGVKQQLRK